MTFLTFPLLIGGLCAAAVPVILHLVMRGVPKRIEFPALRLVQPKMVAHAKKYRLNHLVLLLLRIALLALIGLALARPTIKLADWFPPVVTSTGRDANGSFVSTLASSLTSQDAPVSAVVVIDTSPRMGVLAANKTSLENAKAFARWIIENLPSGSRVAILSGRGDTDIFQIDPLAALKRLDAMTIHNSARRAVDSASRGLSLFKSDPGPSDMPHELYIISDLTTPSWDFSTVTTLTGEVDNVSIFIIDVGTTNAPNNTGVVDASITSQVMEAGRGLGVTAEVQHCGEAASATVELVLRRSDKDASEVERRGSRLVTFDAGDKRESVPFTLAGLDVGVYHATIRLTNSDSLPIDDARYITFDVRAPRDVLLVASEPLQSRTTYLREGLAMAGLAIRTSEMTFESFAATTPRDWNYRALVLLDPPPLAEKRWKELADYAAQGNGVGIFLGRAATPIESFQSETAVRLIGGKMLRQARAADDPFWLVADDSDSPLVAPFQKLGITSPPWNLLPVFRYWEMSDIVSGATIDFRYSDRRVAVVTQRYGRGCVLTMTTPLSDSPADAWNLLPLGEASWVFLLFTEGVGNFLTGGSANDCNYLASDRVVVHPSLEKLPNTVAVVPPSGKEKEFRVGVNTELREIVIDDTEEVGHYAVTSDGAANAGRIETGFSVNVAPWQLSSLGRIDSKLLDTLFGKGAYTIARTPAEVESGIVRRRVGQELFTMLIIVATLFFAAEWIVANRAR
ncbi:MAG: BatA domain-containing protein [Thermoguttaceae bacterium]